MELTVQKFNAAIAKGDIHFDLRATAFNTLQFEMHRDDQIDTEFAKTMSIGTKNNWQLLTEHGELNRIIAKGTILVDAKATAPRTIEVAMYWEGSERAAWVKNVKMSQKSWDALLKPAPRYMTNGLPMRSSWYA